MGIFPEKLSKISFLRFLQYSFWETYGMLPVCPDGKDGFRLDHSGMWILREPEQL